jgi:hypothetical protein
MAIDQQTNPDSVAQQNQIKAELTVYRTYSSSSAAGAMDFLPEVHQSSLSFGDQRPQPNVHMVVSTVSRCRDCSTLPLSFIPPASRPNPPGLSAMESGFHCQCRLHQQKSHDLCMIGVGEESDQLINDESIDGDRYVHNFEKRDSLKSLTEGRSQRTGSSDCITFFDCFMLSTNLTRRRDFRHDEVR